MKLSLAILLMATVASAQKCQQVSYGPYPDNYAVTGSPTPVYPSLQACTGSTAPTLKCGKYEHVEHWEGKCGPAPASCPDGQSVGCYALSVCAPVPPDRCVPDMHQVTEKEWQETQARIKMLEKALKVMIQGSEPKP